MQAVNQRVTRSSLQAFRMKAVGHSDVPIAYRRTGETLQLEDNRQVETLCDRATARLRQFRATFDAFMLHPSALCYEFDTFPPVFSTLFACV